MGLRGSARRGMSTPAESRHRHATTLDRPRRRLECPPPLAGLRPVARRLHRPVRAQPRDGRDVDGRCGRRRAASEQSTSEAARAYDVFGASGVEDPTHRTLVVLGSAAGSIDDPAIAAALDDVLARMAAHTTTIDGTDQPTFAEIVDPRLAPPEAGLIAPDRSAVRIAAAVPATTRWSTRS